MVFKGGLITLEKIAKALGVALSDFFTDEDVNTDINSYDGSLMEKVKAIEALSDDEKKTVFSIVDAFVGKKKLKDALSNVFTDVKQQKPLKSELLLYLKLN